MSDCQEVISLQPPGYEHKIFPKSYFGLSWWLDSLRSSAIVHVTLRCIRTRSARSNHIQGFQAFPRCEVTIAERRRPIAGQHSFCRRSFSKFPFQTRDVSTKINSCPSEQRASVSSLSTFELLRAHLQLCSGSSRHPTALDPNHQTRRSTILRILRRLRRSSSDQL